MTTPDSKEAPERVRLSTIGENIWIFLSSSEPDGPGVVEYIRADLVNREPSEGDVERVCRALVLNLSPNLPDSRVDSLWSEWKPLARAAINAWRNP